MSKQKDLSIETLRGLAIILMVAGHVIGDKPTNGMRVGADSEFRHLYYSLQFFRLPLFTVISGFVYTLRPVALGKSVSFMRGKARRILFPMAAVGTLEFFLRYLVPGTNTKVQLSELWKIYVFPFDHFWFLQAIFLVFLTVTLLERFELLKTPWRWGAVIALAAWHTMDMPFAPESNPFSFVSFAYLLPFFLLGLGLGRFPDVLRSPWLIAPAAAALVWGLSWQQGAWYGWQLPLLDRINTESRSSPFGMLIGLTGCTILFRVRWETRWLAWLGHYAYGIYLFHVFGTAGSRIVVKKLLGLEAGVPLFTLSLLAGLSVPIGIEWVLERQSASRPLSFVLRTSRLVFLGLRPKRPPAAPPALSSAPPEPPSGD